MQKAKANKVLIIAYYWPPAGGPGVQRIVKFASRMRDFGWEPVVLTVTEAVSPSRDESLQTLVEDIKVYRTHSREPFGIYNRIKGRPKDAPISKDVISGSTNESLVDKLFRFIRANFFIPDARIGWIPSMVKQGMHVIRAEKPDLIFSTSPPHSLQLGARRLARKSGLPWIADFRDPWHEAYWLRDLPRSGLSRWLDKRLEKRVLCSADKITTPSKGFEALFKSKCMREYNIIHSGYIPVDNKPSQGEKFVISYLGNLTKYHFVRPLLEAVNSLDSSIKEMLILDFAGKVYSGFEEVASSYPEVQTRIIPFMPRQVLLEYTRSTSLLFLPGLEGTVYEKSIIGAKFYDYLALQRPLLALGSKGAEEERLIQESEYGVFFYPEMLAEMQDFLIEKYLEWERKGITSVPLTEKVKAFSTAANVRKLCGIFSEISGINYRKSEKDEA
jgi:glycosyltransferase involved in cell wall biosynthesis